MTQDCTIIYYTANRISQYFAHNTMKQLLVAAQGLPIIAVSQLPLHRYANEDFFNIVLGDIGQKYLNIYRQALEGARRAKTKYIAMAEDDILYSPDHYNYRPTPGTFAYNVNVESLFTWINPPIFGHKDRRNLHSLICEKDLFIEAMEERFAKYPSDDMVKMENWSEPGKYEKLLRVTERVSEKFNSGIPNIAFSHPAGFQFKHLGTRKKLDRIRKTELPYWGTAEQVMSLYA